MTQQPAVRRGDGRRSGDTRGVQRALRALVLSLAAVLPFVGALHAEFLDWDDDLNIVRNERFRGFGAAELGWMFGSFHMGHYHPLTWLSFAVDHALWGLNPVGYHLTNLLLHGANAFLFAAVLGEVCRHALGEAVACSNRGRWLAAFGAMLFAAHPLRVESVVWVTERRDVLSAAFWLATVWTYLVSARAGERRLHWLVLGWALFALSLASKAWGITLPVVLLLLDVWPLRRRLPWARLLLEKLPFFALAGVFALVAASAQSAAGAVMSLADHGVIGRCLQAAYGLCLYLRNSVVPLDLSPLYPLQAAVDPGDLRFLVPLILVVLGGIMLAARRRQMPGLVVGFALVVVIAAPVLGFLQSGGQLAADRYTYLACLPLPVMVVAWWARRPAIDRVATPVAVVWVIVLGTLAARHAHHWHSSERLWDRVLALYPDSVEANLHRGLARTATGDLPAALAAFRRASEAATRYERPRYEMGRVLHRLNRLEEARVVLAEAVALGGGGVTRPYLLAVTAMQLGRHDEALTACIAARALDPSYPHTYLVQADALERLGRRDEAIASLEELLRLDAGYAGAAERLRQLRR